MDGYKLVTISASLFVFETNNVQQLVYHRPFVHATFVKRNDLSSPLTTNETPTTNNGQYNC